MQSSFMKSMTIESIRRRISHMNCKNPRAFTLIELLVVIAIIAILVAIVTVAAGMMLQRAKSTKDMGNHKMTGMPSHPLYIDTPHPLQVMILTQ